jgi:hypothetical protein
MQAYARVGLTAVSPHFNARLFRSGKARSPVKEVVHVIYFRYLPDNDSRFV